MSNILQLEQKQMQYLITKPIARESYLLCNRIDLSECIKYFETYIAGGQ